MSAEQENLLADRIAHALRTTVIPGYPTGGTDPAEHGSQRWCPQGCALCIGDDQALAGAVLAVVQPELDRLREVEAVHNEMTGGIHPLASCVHGHTTVHVAALARQIADKRTALHRRDQAVAEVARVRALHQPVQYMSITICDHCSVQRSTGPQAWERAAIIPYPCQTVQAIEGEL